MIKKKKKLKNLTDIIIKKIRRLPKEVKQQYVKQADITFNKMAGLKKGTGSKRLRLKSKLFRKQYGL